MVRFGGGGEAGLVGFLEAGVKNFRMPLLLFFSWILSSRSEGASLKGESVSDMLVGGC